MKIMCAKIVEQGCGVPSGSSSVASVGCLGHSQSGGQFVPRIVQSNVGMGCSQSSSTRGNIRRCSHSIQVMVQLLSNNHTSM